MSDSLEEVWASHESSIAPEEVDRACAAAGDDQVVCRECAQALGQITEQHLRTHDTTLAEYKAANPGRRYTRPTRPANRAGSLGSATRTRPSGRSPRAPNGTTAGASTSDRLLRGRLAAVGPLPDENQGGDHVRRQRARHDRAPAHGPPGLRTVPPESASLDRGPRLPVADELQDAPAAHAAEDSFRYDDVCAANVVLASLNENAAAAGALDT